MARLTANLNDMFLHLKQTMGEATWPLGYALRSQQRKFYEIVHHFNYELSNTSLKLETPGAVLEYFPRVLRKWSYSKDCEVRRVTKNGTLR